MRAAGPNPPSLEPWMSPIRPRGTIAPHLDGEPGDALEGAGAELEGRTTPFQRIDASVPGPDEVASEAAIEAPAPLPDALESRSLSTDVLRLTRIAKYELTSTIGHGSFGVVYTARDTELDREVALKILNPCHHGDGDAMHRFLREARAAARIAHPGIVTVHDCGRYTPDDGDELAYIAMELLAGESLTRRLERTGPFPPEEAAEVARQVASALDAAHRADVLHRDLKPDNVFLVPDPAVPSGERAKVLDFGLAKIGASRHTELGAVFGTPLYMSPEQCRSSGGIDARSDIYALGCILFELLAGRAPFEGAIYQVLERHLYEAAPDVAALVPGIPPALAALVAEMLEKDPDDRPPTMADVERRLDEIFAPRLARGSARAPAEPAPIAAPLELDEADRAALEAIARRGARGWTAWVVAIAIGLAIAGAAGWAWVRAAVGGMTPAP